MSKMTAEEKLKDIFIEKYKNEKWFHIGKIDQWSLLELLEDAEVMQEKYISGSRWWDNIEKIVRIEDTFFRYEWARTTGDMGAQEAGWEFDWDTLDEVIPYTETITVTKYKRA
jgi:hypothetical protein